MSTRSKRSAFTHAEWDKLNVKEGGFLDDRIHEIRSGHPLVTYMEAKTKVLAEHGYDCMDTAIALGIDVGTVHNHHSHLRHKAGVGKDAPFHSIFL
jgi:DNA-binding CsgD family transcriptional regulator